jgi:hypothetical protein
MSRRLSKAGLAADSASKPKEIKELVPRSGGSAKSDMDIPLTGIFGERRHRNGLDGRFTRLLANMLFQLEQEALVWILVAAQLDPHHARMAFSLVANGWRKIDRPTSPNKMQNAWGHKGGHISMLDVMTAL